VIGSWIAAGLLMRIRTSPILLIAIAFLFLKDADALGQTPAGAASEFWPAVKTSIELRRQTRLQLSAGKQDGEDFDYQQWKVGAMLSYRMKRILKLPRADADEENEHYLVIGAGYEYLRTNQNDTTKSEHRIIIEATPRYIPGAGFLLTDRNRIEFRWVNGNYDARYRNKLVIDRRLKLYNFSFTPYASGELFYDRNHHSWNENQYAFGVRLPYRKRLMLDVYYLRQNCTTCSEDPLNVVGLTLNLYFRRKR
jgi:uncharacterized protein DUF2490